MYVTFSEICISDFDQGHKFFKCLQVSSILLPLHFSPPPVYPVGSWFVFILQKTVKGLDVCCRKVLVWSSVFVGQGKTMRRVTTAWPRKDPIKNTEIKQGK